MCLSTLPSRSAISANDRTPPDAMPSIQERALATARRIASRVSCLRVGLASGWCTTPLTEANVGALQGKLMTVVRVDDAVATEASVSGEGAGAGVGSLGSCRSNPADNDARDEAVDHRAVKWLRTIRSVFTC